jgi:hypothetical protein
VSQIFIDGREFLIIRPSGRHNIAEFLAIGIDARTHGGDEFRKALLLDEIGIRSERPDLPRHAAVHVH